MPFQQGQTLNNRYRIVKLLGQGGFGAVYRAWDTNLSRPCAVKENLDTSPEAQRQFSREATVLANLSHPNLPRVTDHFSVPGQGQYLVMDFVDGEDLASKLEIKGPLPIEQALYWIGQVADALTYLHSRTPPVLHRDIKPANIRITPAGESTPFGKAMLVDFGLVKIASPHLKTTAGARAVTPGYAPPEQYGQGITDERTDLYALGATLYSLLTNQRPTDSLQRIMGKQIPPVGQLNPQVPEQLSKVIARVMSLDPKQRYQSADDFKAALSISIPTLVGNLVLPSGEELQRAAAPADATRLSTPPARQVSPQPVRQTAAPARGDRQPDLLSPRQASTPPRQQQRAVRSQKPFTRTQLWKSWQVWAIVSLVVLCLGAVAVGLIYLPSLDGGISEEDFQATVDERVLRTSTAQAKITARAQQDAEGTSTPQKAPGTTEEARQQLIDAALANRTSILGPTQGTLAHNPASKLIAGQTLGVDVQYFILEVRFYNPYAATRAGWDYGLLFRHLGSNQHLRLILRSDKSLVLMNNTGESSGAILFQGNVPDLNIEEGGWNLLMLFCLDTPDGDRTLIYLNKIFITEADISVRTNSGDIAIVTGAYEGDQIEGEITEYRDLNLWSVP